MRWRPGCSRRPTSGSKARSRWSETALAKIRAGADVLQLYSALVFRGLGLVADIKAALTDALDRGEAAKLSDLVGMDAAAVTAEDWPV
jgi:dihydroorotate dehydrogenase